MESEERKLMKKILILSISFFMALFCAFAAGTDTVTFDIVWRHNVNSVTTISILDYSGESPLQDDTKNLDEVGTRQNVCLIKYSSNAGGIHTLTYRATALQTANHDSAVGYKLYFTYEDQIAVLEVGDDIGTTYPAEANSVYNTFEVPFGSSDSVVFDVFVNAELNSIEDFHLETKYTSTVTIERVSV